MEMGLNKGDLLYLSQPGETESFKYAGLELRDEIERRKQEKIQQREQAQKKPKDGAPKGGVPTGIKKTQG